MVVALVCVVRFIAVLTTIVLFASAAHADHRTLDLHDGVVLGSPELMGMAGAGVALPGNVARMGENPAGAAMRAVGDTSFWGGDVGLDLLLPSAGSDIDGDGKDDSGWGYAQLGGLLQIGSWAVGFSGRSRAARFIANDRAYSIYTTHGGLTVAKSFAEGQVSLGAAIRPGGVTLEADGRGEILDSFHGALGLGTQVAPRGSKFRFGAAAAIPFGKSASDHNACVDPACAGIMAPDNVTMPWNVTLGVAWQSDAPLLPGSAVIAGDGRVLLLAADAGVSGAVAEGVGLHGMVANEEQRSGDGVTPTLRVGASYEWVPTWVRVLGGTYWQGGRFHRGDGSQVSGRLHGTAGTVVRTPIKLWGRRYLAVKAAVDVAPRYREWAVTVGLW